MAQFGRYFEEFNVGDVYKHWPGRTITESELMERLRKSKRRMRRIEWTLILMLPMLIPWFVVVSIWTLVTAPFRRGRRPR